MRSLEVTEARRAESRIRYLERKRNDPEKLRRTNRKANLRLRLKKNDADIDREIDLAIEKVQMLIEIKRTPFG